ncbi:MAG: hypothetical protein HRU00_00040 [Myxococcales bacterium]|nr:hypothetical protein [Myxococcales bacterium]
MWWTRIAAGIGVAVSLWAASAGARAQSAEAQTALRCPLEAGRASIEISAGNRTREVEIEVGPRARRDGPAPVVFLWHGWGGGPRRMLDALDLARTWPEAVAVAPRGLPRRFPGMGPRTHPGWQIEAGEFDDRDLRLFDALVRQLSQLECLDATRFTSSGFSNGGYFSNLLGCRRARVLAAIAPVAGGGPYEDSCEAPVAAWIAHGSRDHVVPIREGRESFATWQKRNACKPMQPGSQGCTEAKDCTAPVVFCSFESGHAWPRRLTPSWKRFLRDQRLPAMNQP